MNPRDDEHGVPAGSATPTGESPAERFLPVVVSAPTGDSDSDTETDDDPSADRPSTGGALDQVLPVLPLRNSVLYPGALMPLAVGRPKTLRLLNAVGTGGTSVFPFADSSFSRTVIIRNTASTAMGASSVACCATTFELSDVLAASTSAVRSLSRIGVAMPSIIPIAFSSATANASDTVDGCRPRDSSSSVACSKLPHMTTTDVVPSPATVSWAFESATSIFAAGCSTFI